MISRRTRLALQVIRLSAKEESGRRKRDCFLYMEPKTKSDQSDFAQCGSCRFFTDGGCLLFSPGDEVLADASCGLYVKGDPIPKLKGKEQSLVTPQEAGYVSRQVRCENCVSFEEGGICKLFQTLNQKLPELFDLEENVKAFACCNAQEPKE